MAKFDHLLNKKFNKLTVIGIIYPEAGRIRLSCRCECDKIKEYLPYQVVSGGIKSCGRLTDKNTLHGHSTRQGKSTEYHSWGAMKARCYNKHNVDYKDYGDIGITVCDRWIEPKTGFSNFLEDLGLKPTSRHTIERLDVNKGYSKDNCRWATKSEQSLNQRKMAGTHCKYKGVFYRGDEYKYKKPYYVHINHKYIGTYATQREAAEAYDREFEKLYPEAAKYGTNKGLGLFNTGCPIKIVFKPQFEYLSKR